MVFPKAVSNEFQEGLNKQVLAPWQFPRVGRLSTKADGPRMASSVQGGSVGASRLRVQCSHVSKNSVGTLVDLFLTGWQHLGCFLQGPRALCDTPWALHVPVQGWP